MKLTKYQLLRIKLAKITLQTLWLSLWLNAVYEFHGPIQAWVKLTERLYSDSSVVTRRDMSRLKFFIFGDFSFIKPNPNRHLLLLQLYTVFDVLRIEKIVKLFPLDVRILEAKHTGRFDYYHERSRYRFSHHIAKQGYDLKTHYYEEYKYIAQKYNWPIIYNSTEEDYS